MNINWKLRIKNKTTLLALLACIVTFAYQAMGIMGIVPPVAQDAVMQLVGIVLNILVCIGVLVDPTTSGPHDSKQALEYQQPK